MQRISLVCILLAVSIFASCLLPQATMAKETSPRTLADAPLQPADVQCEPSLDEVIGQMLLAGFRGAYVSDNDPIVRDIEQYHLGGVVLFNYDVALGTGPRNIISPMQLEQLTATLQAKAFQACATNCTTLPLFIGVDQEGGKVQRLRAKAGFKETGSPAQLAVNPDDPLPTMAAALVIGQQLARGGINLDFAPVLDLNVNPDNPVIGKIGRSFGADPAQVTKLAAAFIDTLREEGVLSCVKHFPGHGSSRDDSHLGLTDVTDTWTDTELQPFASIISAGRADMVMTAHLFNAHWDKKHPATLSRAVITGILREKLGYAGVIITDDMNMRAITDAYGLEEAIFLAIEAGSDILLFGNNLTFDPDIVPKAHGIIKTLVASGRISKERLRASYNRIVALKRTIIN